jgi:hypothetical protein
MERLAVAHVWHVVLLDCPDRFGHSFVRWLPIEGHGHEALHESLIEILKRRYAQGEIEKEEAFEQLGSQ